MKAMILNDVEKSWMTPLLELRNELDFRGDDQRRKDRERRDFRRLSGQPQLNRTGDNLVPGPYTQSARATWLERLLRVQTVIRGNPDAPNVFRSIQLISPEELKAIRRMWVENKHEVEDLVPKIYERATGTPYFDLGEEAPVLDVETLSLLEQAVDGDRIQYETLRNMLHIEHVHRSGSALIAKRGLFQELQSAIESGFFRNAADATEWAKERTVIGEPALATYEEGFKDQGNAAHMGERDSEAATPGQSTMDLRHAV
jgi:DNA sulfur modification protein DndC